VDECEDERTGRGLGWDALDAGRAPGSGQGTCHHFCPLWPVIVISIPYTPEHVVGH
jgi:hypothetical protein